MARRSKEEMRAEFDRLSEIFELFLEFEMSKMHWEEAERTRKLVPTPEQMLAMVGVNGTTMSHIIAGTREAINDNNQCLSEMIEDGDSFAREFLAFYRARTGRDYFDDAGHPKKMARAIFKSGEIADETEFRLMMGVLNNVEQTVFKEKEVEHVSDMLYRFEQSVDEN